MYDQTGTNQDWLMIGYRKGQLNFKSNNEGLDLLCIDNSTGIQKH